MIICDKCGRPILKEENKYYGGEAFPTICQDCAEEQAYEDTQNKKEK